MERNREVLWQNMDTSQLGFRLDYRLMNNHLKLEDGQHHIQSLLEDIQHQTRNNSYRLNYICEHLNTNHGGYSQTENLQVPQRAHIHSFHSNSSSSEDERIRTANFESSCMSMALKMHTVDIVRCLPFTESEIPDIIIPDCVTEDECASIRNKRDRKDQVRTLIRMVINRSFQAKMKLLEVIHQHNADLGTKIKKSFQALIEDEAGNKKTCTVCLLKQSVDIKDVCDFYYAKDMISDDLHSRITDVESFCENQHYLWDNLLREMNGVPDEIVMNIMIESLEEKGTMFSNVIRLLRRDVQRKRHLSCRCEIDHHRRPDSLPSTRSSTASSVYPHSSFPETIIENSMESSGTVCSNSDDEETAVKQLVKITQTPSSISHTECYVSNVPHRSTHATTTPSKGAVNKNRIPKRFSLRDKKSRSVIKKQQLSVECQRTLNEKKAREETEDTENRHGTGIYRGSGTFNERYDPDGMETEVTLRPGKKERQDKDLTKRHAKTEHMLY